MRTNRRKSILTGVPSWILSLVTVFLTAVLLNIINDIGEIPSYIIYSIIIIVACFIICRNDPTSIWYVPIICNIFSFFIPVLDNTFWTTAMGIIIMSGVVLSVIAAILGARMGKRNAVSEDQPL
jgi:hypothetical protein